MSRIICGILVSVLMGLIMSACSLSPMDGTTTCKEYLVHSDSSREDVAERVSVENQAADAGNPMQYLNADEYCQQHPSATISDAIGKSDAKRAQAATQAAPPEVKQYYDASNVTHVSGLCVPGQPSTNLIVTGNPIAAERTVSLSAGGKVLATFRGKDQSGLDGGATPKKLVSIRCGSPINLTGNSDTISVQFPEHPGEILTNTDTSSFSDPPTLDPNGSSVNGKDSYQVVVDS
jgi:hypothetical protein